MADFDIIDCHVHTFPSADRGMTYQRGTGRSAEAIKRYGTIPELLGLMKENGISKSIMLMYTPTRYMYESRVKGQEMPSNEKERAHVEAEIQTMMAQRMIANNEWAIEVGEQHPELVSFAGLDPVYMDEAVLLGEIDDKIKRGAKGVKIVLRALAIYADDPRLWPVYKRITELDVPITSQVGETGEAGDRGPYANPKFFEKALKEFPNLRVNAVHLGHGFEEEIADLAGRFPGFYTDFSSRLASIEDPKEPVPQQWFVDFIRRCGADRVMFGTNYPGGDPEQYTRLMQQLPLTDAEKEMVAAGNAKRFAKL